MELTPATFQSVYANPRPSFMENFVNFAGSGLQGYFNRQAQQREENMKMLPVFAQMNMIRPAKQGETPTFSTGGPGQKLPWMVTSPNEYNENTYGVPGAKSWADTENYYQAQDLKNGTMSPTTAVKLAASVAAAYGLDESAISGMADTIMKTHADLSKKYFAKPEGSGAANPDKTKIDAMAAKYPKIPRSELVKHAKAKKIVPDNYTE